MTDDVELQYANNPILKAHEVRQMFKDIFTKLDKMEHHIRYFDYVAPRIYQSATIRYVVKGDDAEKDEIVIPGFAVFFVRKGEDSKIKCNRAEIYLDPSLVLQQIEGKSHLQQSLICET